MTMQAFKKVIDQTFPEENFDDAKKKLLDICAEFESPQNVINALAEKKEVEFRRSVLEVAQRMESHLPRLKVEVVAPSPLDDDKEEDDDDDEDDAEDLTFSVTELRRAFPGSWEDWDKIVNQEDPEVKAFLARRRFGAQVPPPPYRSVQKSGGSATKKSAPARVERKTAVAAAPAPAPKRKLSSGVASSSAAKSAPPPEKKIASPADGKRQRRFWAREEELDLVKGVRKYGKGSWRKIMQDQSLKFYERSATDLKDKWRNLEKKKEEYEKELDAMEDVDDDDDDDDESDAKSKRKPQKKTGSKRVPDQDDQDDVEDSDIPKISSAPVVVKKEPASKKQALSPSQIRESALEARNRRLQQLNQ